MKESGVSSPPKQFFHLRRKIWQTPEGDICVTLPKEWCVRHRFGHPAEIDICGFPDLLILFPAGERQKLKEVNGEILAAVNMIELCEEFRKALKDAEKAAKGLKRRFTRSKRKR